MNYQELLERFSYEDDHHILDRISKSSMDYQEHRDIMNEIVLWKINRMIHIDDETIKRINSLFNIEYPLELLENTQVKTLLESLLNSKGVQLPMASTILHFYYPNLFPIIDQRAYRELYSMEYPTFYSKDSINKYIALYLEYIKSCYEYNKNNCPEIPFRNIDKILYQLDKEKANKVKY